MHLLLFAMHKHRMPGSLSRLSFHRNLLFKRTSRVKGVQKGKFATKTTQVVHGYSGGGGRSFVSPEIHLIVSVVVRRQQNAKEKKSDLSTLFLLTLPSTTSCSTNFAIFFYISKAGRSVQLASSPLPIRVLLSVRIFLRNAISVPTASTRYTQENSSLGVHKYRLTRYSSNNLIPDPPSLYSNSRGSSIV